MSRNGWISLALGLVIVVGAVLIWRHLAERRPTTPGAATTSTASEAGSASARSTAVNVYFPSTSAEALYPERRELPADDFVRALVEAVIAGPEGASLAAPLPDGVTLGDVFLFDDTVLLDLRTADGQAPPFMGSSRELLAVYSLVDTVVLGVDEVDRVGLLWNGRQEPTFAGHVDTTRPLEAKPSLIARP